MISAEQLPSLDQVLRDLGLNERWYQSGLLKEEHYRAAWLDCRKACKLGKDDEHFRVRIYGSVFSASFSREQIISYLELIEFEEDKSLADWARSLVVESMELQDIDVEWLMSLPLLERHVKNRFFLQRNYFVRKLRSEAIAQSIVLACLESQDEFILKMLLNHPSVSLEDKENATCALESLRNSHLLK